ncbi:PD-(D/E)XK nuclease family protein [Sphingomonas aurantiaca]
MTFEQHRRPDPAWNTLLDVLARYVPIQWLNEVGAATSPSDVSIVACGDPRGECVEALRWVRHLIASGAARPEEIAIVAASPGSYDEHMLALCRASLLPIHFSHGVPVLATRPGQACAALADVLHRGLSQARVRRVMAHGGKAAAIRDLPPAPLSGIHREAPLDTVEQWNRALGEASAARADRADIADALRPMLTAMGGGPASSAEAGALVLPSDALAIWETLLRSNSGAGISLALAGARSRDDRDPGASAVWCPADHLIGAPRPWIRMLGLNARVWPRPETGDPLLPPHILSLPADAAPTRLARDRDAFDRLRGSAAGGLVLSQARRSDQGGRLAPSDLMPVGPVVNLARTRTPEHAFSEADRLRARPDDAAAHAAISRACDAHRARRLRHLTPHDGLVRSDHPAIARVLERPQSATSLQRLVRDPLGYVWHYALGWRAPATQVRPLSLDDRAFGVLVHILLQKTVDTLEQGAGFGRASEGELEEAVEQSVAWVRQDWPIRRATPPPLLWAHTLEAARNLAQRALTLDQAFAADTRSWTEVGFGQAAIREAIRSPWDASEPVFIPGTAISIAGAIDRLEISGDQRRAQITDYKTGKPPANVAATVLAGYAALQRVVYGVAVRQLVPEARVLARLVYLGDDDPTPYRISGDGLDAAISTMAGHVGTASGLLRRGVCLPGQDAEERWNRARIAHPAAAENYRLRKLPATSTALSSLMSAWRER